MFKSTFQSPFQNPFPTEGAADGWVTPTDITAEDAASLKYLYDLTDGANWTNNTNWGQTETAADWFGLSVYATNRIANIFLGNNNLIGNISSWVMPDWTRNVYFFSNPLLVGDLSSWVINIRMDGIRLYDSGLGGDVTVWDISNGIQVFYMYSASFYGDMSSWKLSLGQSHFRVYDNSFSGGGVDVSTNTAIKTFYMQDNGLSQVAVDANILEIYNRRASFVDAAPAANFGGTNAAPSGIYQDATPPTTGKEHIFKLENDPDAEGFNTWSITYTA